MNYANPKGWRDRRRKARARARNAKSVEERAAIAATRRAFYEAEARGEVVTQAPAPDPTPEAPRELTRDEMIDRLRRAGQFVHPKSKDETLRKKLEDLENGEEEVPAEG